MAPLTLSAVLLFLVVPSRAALPPGYEDELYCPPQYCIREKDCGDGGCPVGGVNSGLECFSKTLDQTKDIDTWGSERAASIKDDLLKKCLNHPTRFRSRTPF